MLIGFVQLGFVTATAMRSLAHEPIAPPVPAPSLEDAQGEPGVFVAAGQSAGSLLAPRRLLTKGRWIVPLAGAG
jgi:hypothetical protein